MKTTKSNIRCGGMLAILVLALGMVSNTGGRTPTNPTPTPGGKWGINLMEVYASPLGDYFVEDFERGDFSKFPWEHSGDASWSITSWQKHSGTYSAEAGSISHDESTTLQVTLDCLSGNITFYRKVSSEAGYDYLKFYINGVQQDQWSGEENWAEVSLPVTAGTRTYTWTYSKDNSVSRGDDTACIDDIVFPILSSGFLEAAQTYTNPVISKIGPADPTVLFYKGKYYMYPTGGGNYRVYTSKDLVNWQTGPVVFSPGGPNVWAPDVFYNSADGKFYLYYTANWKIGVAMADKPVGPFVNKGILVNGAIDAHVFQDADGKYYLYFSTNVSDSPWVQTLYVQEMINPLQLSGNSRLIIEPSEPWERNIAEGPWLIKHGGIYYVLYSGGGAKTKHYAVGYATSNNPLGPFTKYQGNPIIKGGDGIYGPGHGSVTKDAAGNLWHIYHQKQGTDVEWARFICIDPMWFDSEGVLHGKATRGTPQPGPAVTELPSLDGDCDVDMYDFVILGSAWLSRPWDGNWNPVWDISERTDNVIDVLDLAVLSENWLEDCLVGYWKLDEAEGNIVHDSVGDNHGNLHGEPVWKPTGGKLRGALEFDGVDDYISTPFVLNPADGEFSVFAWIKGGAPGQVVISQIGGANWLSADPSEGKLMTELSCPAGRFSPPPLVSESVITDGIWHRVGFVWDGSNRTLYVDDVEVAKDTQTGLAGATGGLYIGAGKNLDAGSFFSGLIDDVRIYDRALTP